jgi:glycosyltransferase involved in cell wall biosynthesis
VGGVPELVEDGRTGLLVPPRDPAALAAAMTRLHDAGEDARRAMGRRGRELVAARHGPAAVLDRWEAVLGGEEDGRG